MLVALLLAVGAAQKPDISDLSRYAAPNEKVSYTQNLGQWDKRALFRGHFSGADVWVTRQGITYGFRKAALAKKKETAKDRVRARHEKKPQTFEGYAVGVEFIGATGNGKAVGIDPKQTLNNFYRGKDRRKWVTGAQNFGAVMVKDLYPGIDLVSYADRTSRPRYDLVVHPGADPAKIKMRYTGAKNMRLDEKGQINYDTPLGKVTERQQIAIQQGKKAQYRYFAKQVLAADGTVSFNVDGYRKDRTLVIDPLVYSTFLGGDDEDDGVAIRLGSDDTNYLSGDTASTDFPGSGSTYMGSFDTYVSSVSADGSTLLWTTLLGGTDTELNYSMTNDPIAEKLYVGGVTDSTDFPITTGTSNDGATGYVAKFDQLTGTMDYSRVIGGDGDDMVSGLALDGSNVIALGNTNSSDFPTTSGAYQETLAGLDDLFITKLSSDGSTFVFSTLLGGTDDDMSGQVAVNGSGSIYVVGTTFSTDFPMAGTPFQPTYADGQDGVVAAINGDGTSLLSSTYLGGTGYESLKPILIDGSNVIVGGVSYSTDYYTTGDGEPYDMFGGGVVTILDDQLSTCSWSTFFGQPAMTEVAGIVKTATGIAITGMVFDQMYTTPDAVQSTWAGSDDAYIANLVPGNPVPTYATYVGGDSEDCGFGIAVTSTGDLRITGCTESADFPLENALQPTFAGVSDVFLTSVSVAGTSFYVTSDRGDDPHIAGGVGLTMQVYVQVPTTAGCDVTLTSPSPTTLTVNGGTSATVTVDPGFSEATFTVEAVGSVATTTPINLEATATTPGAGTLEVNIEPFVTAVNLTSPYMYGSRKMYGEVEVYEPPAVRTAITLSDDSPNVTMTPTTYVEAGCGCSDEFTIYSFPVDVDETVTVTATYGASAASALFDLKTPMIASVKAYGLSTGTSTIQAGDFAFVVVRFQAPVLGTKVFNVASSDPSKFPDTEVIVYDGTQEGYNITPSSTFTGSKTVTVNLTATYGAQTVVGKLRIIPVGLANFEVLKADVAEGNSIPVRATLLAPAVGDTTVTITSGVPGAVSNTTIVVPDGELFVDTTIPSGVADLSLPKSVRLVATIGSSSKTAWVTVHPAVLSVVLNPSAVTGGSDSVGEITLFEALEYDLTLDLGSGSSSATPDSPTILIPQGDTTGSFTIHTIHRNVVKSARITVSRGAWLKAIYLTVNP